MDPANSPYKFKPLCILPRLKFGLSIWQSYESDPPTTRAETESGGASWGETVVRVRGYRSQSKLLRRQPQGPGRHGKLVAYGESHGWALASNVPLKGWRVAGLSKIVCGGCQGWRLTFDRTLVRKLRVAFGVIVNYWKNHRY